MTSLACRCIKPTLITLGFTGFTVRVLSGGDKQECFLFLYIYLSSILPTLNINCLADNFLDSSENTAVELKHAHSLVVLCIILV